MSGQSMAMGSRKGPYGASTNGKRATRGAVKPDDFLLLSTMFFVMWRGGRTVKYWERVG